MISRQRFAYPLASRASSTTLVSAGRAGAGPGPRIVRVVPKIGRTPVLAQAAAKRGAPYSPSRSVSATAGIDSSAARAASSSGENAPSFSEKYDRTSRCTKDGPEESNTCSILGEPGSVCPEGC